MFHIILIILKIIGTVILVLLCLILSLLLLVLLVPVRYRAYVTHGDGFYLRGTAGWLLHIIHARVLLVNEDRNIKVRLFGFVVYDSQKPIKPKKHKNSDGKADRKAGDIKNELKDEIKYAEATREAETTRYFKEAEKIEESEKTEDAEKTEEAEIIEKAGETEEAEKPEKAEDAVKAEEADVEEAEETFFGKLINKIKSFFHRSITFLINVKNKIVNGFIKACNIKRKISLLLEFIRDEINQEGFKAIYHSLKKLIKHILPTKLKSRLVFGTGDPCSTGQALGAAALLFGIYGNQVQITPDFKHKVFEGEHDARGRIRLITILIILIKLISDKRFKRLKTKTKRLKEALLDVR